MLHRNSANLMQSMLDEVKNSITILPELQALIPPLQVSEFEQLEANIRKEGCREALLIWQTTQGIVDGTSNSLPLNILIDGHNRHSICSKNSIDFKVALREFPSLQSVRDFMIDNQLGRRNLTPEQMSYLRGLKYRNERQATGRPVQAGVAATTGETETRASQRTRDKLAKQFNVSPRTILRDRDYSEGIDRLTPELKQEVLKGNQKVPKEIVREIGRHRKTLLDNASGDAAGMVSSETPPLSLAEVNAITLDKKTAGVESAAPLQSEVSILVKQIAQLASTLNPEKPDFGFDCDRLVALLMEAKKQV